MANPDKTRSARRIGYLCVGIALFLLLDDIFFNIISGGRMVPIAMMFLMGAIVAFSIAKKGGSDQ